MTAVPLLSSSYCCWQFKIIHHCRNPYPKQVFHAPQQILDTWIQ